MINQKYFLVPTFFNLVSTVLLHGGCPGLVGVYRSHCYIIYQHPYLHSWGIRRRGGRRDSPSSFFFFFSFLLFVLWGIALLLSFNSL